MASSPRTAPGVVRSAFGKLGRGLRRLQLENPVMLKEMRTRMRGSRAYWLLTGYLLFLSFVLFFQYTSWFQGAEARGGFSASSKMGAQFFQYIFWTQVFLVALIAPAVTSGGITIEREQRTFEMLCMTRLSASAIVWGKLLAAAGFVALLLVSSLPLTSMCFILGGVSPEQVSFSYIVLLAASFVTGALGLMWSSVARTTAAASIFTLLSVVMLPIAFLFAMGMAAMAFGLSGNTQWFELMFGVVIALYGFLLPDMFGSGAISSFFQGWNLTRFYGLTVPMWLAPLLTYGIIATALVCVAASRMDPQPDRRAWKLRALAAVYILQQTFFLFGARFRTAANVTGGMLWGGVSAPLGLMVYPVVLLLFLVPVFATGQVRRSSLGDFARWAAGGWHPRAVVRGGLPSAIPLLLALFGVTLGMYALSWLFVGQPAGLLTGQFGGAKASLRDIAAGGLVQTGLATASALVGFASLGLLLSALTRNRWAAMVGLYLVVAICLIAPAIAHQVHYLDPSSPSANASINLYYLNPALSYGEACATSGTFWDRLPLWFGRTPLWAVTVAAHGLLTVVSWVLTCILVAFSRRPDVAMAEQT